MPQLPGQAKTRWAHDQCGPFTDPKASDQAQSLGGIAAFDHRRLVFQNTGQDQPTTIRQAGPLVTGHLAKWPRQNVGKDDVKGRRSAHLP